MEPRCCHLSRRFSDSNHSSCSMRQQIGKWLFVSNTSALIHWGILFPLTLKVKYAEFSSSFQLRLAEEIHSTQEHKWLHEFAKHFGKDFSDSTVRLYIYTHTYRYVCSVYNTHAGMYNTHTSHFRLLTPHHSSVYPLASIFFSPVIWISSRLQ